MSYLNNEKKEDFHQNQKGNNKPFNPLSDSNWWKKILSWVIRIGFIGGIILMFIWPNFPKYNSVKPLCATIRNDDNGYYLHVNLEREAHKKIYYADKNKNLNYDCFAYYFQSDQQKTTYSFHGKPQGAKEIEFKIVVEPNLANKGFDYKDDNDNKKDDNESSKNEKIFLIGGKTIANDVKGSDHSRAYLLFEDWITYVTTNADHLPSPGPNIFYLILHTLPSILLIYFLFSSMLSISKISGGKKGNDLFGFGKNQSILAKSNVKFKDVAGIEEEKAELIEIVDYLKNPEKYVAMGARTPKGVLLYGPPGTGKTLLAKAVAGEAKVPFFQVSGSSFDDMFVGVGAKRVRDLFAKAKKAAPAIVFIDEIDSVASKRGQNSITGGGGIIDQTINQLLAEMDGFNTKTGIVVMAATNRLKTLDEAILRPGRFDRIIQVYLPDIKEREAILKIHAKNKNLSTKINLNDIARRTPGFSGAQLENVLNEATLLAVRQNKNVITIADIDEAIDRVMAGPAKHTRVISEEEKKQIATHEAGHALVGLFTKGGEVVEKITIIPRGTAAGYMLSTPEKQEIAIKKKSDLLAVVRMALGGRAAEMVKFGKDAISTGAINDLYKATSIVKTMVTQLGMSEAGMTQFVPYQETKLLFDQKFYSNETALKIDKEIENIIQNEYNNAIKIIKNNKKELNLIVESLIILETIVKEQIDYIHKNLSLPPEAIAKKNEMSKS